MRAASHSSGVATDVGVERADRHSIGAASSAKTSTEVGRPIATAHRIAAAPVRSVADAAADGTGSWLERLLGSRLALGASAVGAAGLALVESRRRRKRASERLEGSPSLR
jgi:hypothetical protein